MQDHDILSISIFIYLPIFLILFGRLGNFPYICTVINSLKNINMKEIEILIKNYKKVIEDKRKFVPVTNAQRLITATQVCTLEQVLKELEKIK